MAQHDGIIDNGAGATVRADLNALAEALLSTSAGTSGPSTTYANQLWYDTTNHVLKIRDETNTGWNLAKRATGAEFAGGNTLCAHENLKIVWASNATVTITADAVLLRDTNGVERRFTSLNETPSIASSGANGLDTGAENSSTWYYLWAIGKFDGTLDALISASATSPTMPANYIYKGLLGAVRNDGSSNFIPFAQIGTRVTAHVSGLAFSSLTSTSFAAIDLSTAIPALAKKVYGAAQIATSSGTATVTLIIAPAGSGTTETYGRGATFSLINQSTTAQIFPFSCPITTAQEIKYYVSGANATWNAIITGWEY